MLVHRWDNLKHNGNNRSCQWESEQSIVGVYICWTYSCATSFICSSLQLSDLRTDFTLTGDPEWFPLADFVPKQEDTFGFELGRACFCNNNDLP